MSDEYGSLTPSTERICDFATLNDAGERGRLWMVLTCADLRWQFRRTAEAMLGGALTGLL